MSLRVFSSFLKPLRLTGYDLNIGITGSPVQQRGRRHCAKPKIRYPWYYVKQFRAQVNEELTVENAAFLKEVVAEKKTEGQSYVSSSPLKKEPMQRGEWFPGCRRSGLIGIKIGVVPQWRKDGRSILTTMLQIVDNHVIKYIPPEKFTVNRRTNLRRFRKEGRLGCLVVGAMSTDPQNYTKEYCGLFKEAGILPKKLLTRFPIHPEAAMEPGTPLYAGHFKVGDIVDVSGTTIDRGFQGVMKRWGFHGQPATHGQTKTHRRPGCIGSGSEKARVWRGQKMPGHMGNRLRTMKGLEIMRINHEQNVIYVHGKSIPGNVNRFVYIHDTVLPRKFLKESPRFPTYYPEELQEPLPAEEFGKNLFNFKDPSIVYEVEDVKAKVKKQVKKK